MIDKLFISLGCEVKACSCGCGLSRVCIPRARLKGSDYFTFIDGRSKIYPNSLVAETSIIDEIDINDPNSVEIIKKIIESVC